MNLDMFSNWHFGFLPEIIFYVPGSAYNILKLLLLLSIISFLFLLCIKIISKLFPKKAYKINQFISVLYIIGSIFFPFAVANFADSFFFAPLYILIAMPVLYFVFIVYIIYRWNVIKEMNSHAPLLFPYIKANFWLTSRMSSHFLIPILLFQMPAFNSESKIFYWGIPICMFAVYALYFGIYLNKLHLLLDIEIQPGFLPDNLKNKFNLIINSLKKSGKVKIAVFKEGLFNALALYPEKKIIIGIDLLKKLSPGENTAIAAHEIGHLEDWRSLAAIRRYALCCDFFVFLFCIFSQIKESFFPVLGLICLITAFLIMGFVIKKIVLKAEFNADTYVKNFDESIYSHLKTGLEKLSKMNGIDKDFCKQNNAGHLDIDERQEMVAQGKFSLKRKSYKSIIVFLLSIVIGMSVSFTYYKFFPSKSKQWSKLHDKFHQLEREANYDLAAKSIDNALNFSLEYFSEQHSKTLIILNDLCEFYTDKKEWDKAEQYGFRAYEAGLGIYKQRNLKFVRSLKNLGKLYYYKENYSKAENWFDKALQLQTSLGDSEFKKANTLYWLASTNKFMDKNDKAIKYYNSALQAYNDKDSVEFERSINISIDVAELYLNLHKQADAARYFDQALETAEFSYGKNSGAYADTLFRIGNKYRKNKDYKTAEQIFLRGLNTAKKLIDDKNGRIPEMLNTLGSLYREQKYYMKAIEALKESLLIMEKRYGAMSPSIIYEVWELALVNEQAGNFIQARVLFQRVINLEELEDDIDIESHIESYDMLISVVDKIGDKEASDRLRKKLAAIKQNAQKTGQNL